jgi:hypothetical protein
VGAATPLFSLALPDIRRFHGTCGGHCADIRRLG